ncbi:translation initiation factor IF-2 subunit beta [Candidatus Woesearchaeota archaeon]|nr:translation initiation factor IF-2 subunit beta [Candidatus Woesearchaeota archaeon]
MEDYENMLDRLYENMPEVQLTTERFEVPKVRGHIQGNKTIVTNFHQIAQTLQRPVDHLCKYVLKELATPGDLLKNGIIFGTKTPASRINEKIQKYADEFVTCKECGKPDTKLIREGKYMFKKCLACGARESVRILK